MRHLPNALTILRILVTPYFAWLLTHGRPMPATVVLFVICGFSDFLDGYLSRRFNWRSRLGEVLDPLADKLFLISVYAAFYYTGLAPAWVAGIVLGKDLALVIAGALAFAFTDLRRFPADMWGKVCAVTQGVVALVILAGAPSWLQTAGHAVVAIVTPAAGVHYLLRGWRLIATSGDEPR